MHLDPFTCRRTQSGAEHLYRLGPHATAEFLADVAARIDDLPATLTLLAEPERRLTLAMLRLTGGDRFPQRLPSALPQ